jgi:hypothetical protein
MTGKDSALISDCYRYHSGLSILHLYRDPPPPFPPLDKLKDKIDVYQHAFEGGKTGNHAEIALRRQARKEVIQMFKMITLYLQSIATEADIPALILAGFLIRQASGRKKAVTVPAT